MSLFYLFYAKLKLKKENEARNNFETRKGKKTSVSPQGQGKQRYTRFVARKIYYKSKLLSFLEALDLYNERSRLTMFF
jgi:hypothetical protein